jgi:2,6-dihydroxypseudooxynicotine hydrolase
LVGPPAEVLAAYYDGVDIRAYVRTPPGPGPHPCVVLLDGLESTKEEGLRFEELCLERGIATCAFDGPGQGECYFQAKMRPDFERFTSAVVDVLVERDDIDRSPPRRPRTQPRRLLRCSIRLHRLPVLGVCGLGG